MTRAAARARPLQLESRLEALAEAVDAAAGVADPDQLTPAEALLARAGDRLGHGVEHTVVALAGATGSGKSSLFNTLAGEALSTVGVRRPTTSATSACTWGSEADELLDWLSVPRRHRLAGTGELEGLVLLDLPDHDSTALAHRQEVDRIVAVADMVVWVLDPQKYADAAVHEGYLRPLAGHAGVLLVVLNQSDRLSEDQLAMCRLDLDRLLRADGLADVDTLTTSTRTGAGMDEFRRALSQRVTSRRAALDRLSADLEVMTEVLARGCHGDAGPGGALARRSRQQVVGALVDASGVDAVTSAVAGSHRAHAVAATGWPVTRWARRLRPDPLRRLHLGRGGGTTARTSLPRPGAVERSRVAIAVRQAVDGAADGLPDAWDDALHRVATERSDAMAGRMDTAIAGTDLGTGNDPRWWRAAGAVQTALLAVAVAGALWLAVLAVLGYLRLGDLATPDVGPVPVPTGLLFFGVLAGLLVALVARRAAAVGAGRRARRARRRLEDAVAEVAEIELFAPVDDLLSRHRHFCEALRRAARR